MQIKRWHSLAARNTHKPGQILLLELSLFSNLFNSLMKPVDIYLNKHILIPEGDITHLE